MNWLEFFASIIDSLAWPAVIVAVLYILKDNLVSLIPYIRKLRYKDFELELRETKQQIEETGGAALGEGITPERQRLYQLAEISPRSAILESWLELEKAAAELIATRYDEPGAMTSYSPMRLGNFLYKNELISEKQIVVFNNLRELRNKAVHLTEDTIKSEEAAEYADMALRFASQIRPPAP